jgi:RNA polymerase sigma-70 factor (ECF subfamily)
LGLKADDTEDVCQEVFRAVYRALPAFRRDRPGDSFRGWLRTITLNKIRDQWGRRPPAEATGGSTALSWLNEVADPEVDAEGEGNEEQELGILYRRAIQVLRDEFEDKSWRAFWRVTVDDEPVEQVAASLRMTPNAIYLVRSRIRKRLRELLAELGEEPPAHVVPTRRD